MINLAVIDMLVGGDVVYHVLFYWSGIYCNLWKLYSVEVGTGIFIVTLIALFPFGSLTNTAIIALERVHVTFRPFTYKLHIF